METISLAISRRSKKENPKALRREDQIPGVVYGNTENTPVKCKSQDLHRAYVKAGESTIVELALDEKKIPCLIHAIDLDPVTDRYQHVDFYALDMKKEVTTHVPIHFVGESPAVKTLGGVLVTVMSTITVTCLPKDLPHAFDVDISALAEFHNSITVGSLKAPAGVTIKDATDSVIVTVQEPRAAEEEKPAEAAAAEGAAPAAEGAEAPAADVALKKEEGK